MIYLDVASTAEHKNIDNVIVEDMVFAMKNLWQNPSSLYANEIKQTMDKCRVHIAKFMGTQPEEIIFTSGASESNNMAIRGWVDNVLLKGNNIINIITTPIEHKSIMEAIKNPNLEAGILYCTVDKDGLVDCDYLQSLLGFCRYEPTLVSIGLANNEIGTIQDIKRISDLVHKYNGVLHVDATQAFSHIPVDVNELGIDMMSVSGHKISPVLKGVGFLYKRNKVDIQPLIYGTQENGLRGGTENTFGIIGLNRAISLCDISQDKIDDLSSKRDYFIDCLEHKFGCKLNGSKQRLPNNINVTFPQNITGESLLYVLETSGIHVSTGSACNSKSIEPSHVLKAIGLTNEQAMKTVRFSLPDDITYEDIDKVIEEIDKAIKIIES